MASPMPTAQGGNWPSNGQHMPPHNNSIEFDDNCLQVRPMSLKVHYTFDKEAKVNCLARYPQTLQVQTIPLDEKNSIGVVDLRVCLRAVLDCSPELCGQDGDYTVYAVDYSEPDTPLVGQGLLSWAIETMRDEYWGQPSKMITGRVTKNLMAVFGGGNRENIEVKLRLSASNRVQRPESQPAPDMQPSRPMEQAMTPTSTAEWNSFVQSNPQIGHTGHVSRVASPALSQGHHSNFGQPFNHGPHHQQVPQQAPQQEIQRVAPVPVDPSSLPAQPQSGNTSRPSSRSSRRRAPTGRPRGRPRKKPAEGNTSGYEDGTEGEDGPAKKRAKITKVEKATGNPFGSGPESLRVAASTSGSIRNFRPIAVGNENIAGSHLQEIPRAPTPVPEGGPMGMRAQKSKVRRESTMNREITSSNLPNKPGRALSPSQEDGRSPESLAPTPNYSEGSVADIGSSPPVARTVPFLPTSPIPSSPILPPMPQQQSQADARFMSADVDDLFEDDAATPSLEPLSPRLRQAVEAKDATGIPTQVFQMKSGPNGQDMVHIRNYNTPQPTSMPAGPPSDLPLKRPIPSQPKITDNRTQSQEEAPALGPTPPPTTDAMEKPGTPLAFEFESIPAAGATRASEQSHDTAEEIPQAIVETAQETIETVQPAHEANEPTGSHQETETPQIDSEETPEQHAKTVDARPARPLGRSQSAGALSLPMVPASEPAGPSSLSQSLTVDSYPAPEAPSAPRRANSSGPLVLPIPASDPVGPVGPVFHFPAPAMSEAPCPPSDVLFATPSSPPTRSNKNLVKKQSIKQRLEEAIQNGEMPPFCTNCGAIETPTWRKIWIQDREGVPEYFEYSEKPGKVTAIDILKRDEDEKPTNHRLIKKSLGSDDDKAAWQEQLLCNPCGIWLVKCKSHRPRDRWDKDAARLGQERRKRGANGGGSRNKRSRTKTESQTNLTSEAYPMTDPIGPQPSSPGLDGGNPSRENSRPESQGQGSSGPSASTETTESNNEPSQTNPGSTHSRGDGTAKSPIDIEIDEQLGSTRRLLFPSPRREGTLKALCEVDVNVVQTTECRFNKEPMAEKENLLAVPHEGQEDDLEALFRSPAPPRPSTPPNARSAAHIGTLKTPNNLTPSHRPITRSVSKSLRSAKTLSPSQALALLKQTPTGSGRRRSPRNHQNGFDSVFDTSLSRTINQMLSEPNFDINHHDLDLSNLPVLESGDHGMLDLGSLLSTEAAMPSSPPKISFNYSGSANIWEQWGLDNSMDIENNEE